MLYAGVRILLAIHECTDTLRLCSIIDPETSLKDFGLLVTMEPASVTNVEIIKPGGRVLV